ncbi:MAG: sulfide/dihydroorotate dehydrogenase-like FAD/NAD-binding protein [Fusobacteriota bacterium]
MYKILEKRIINDKIEEMKVLAPFVSKKCEPGQFIILRVGKKGERIPLTIVDFDREKESVTIIYQIVGHSTELLSQKEAGDYIEDFAGPLGKATQLGEPKKILGIGGGVGAAPLYPQVKKLKKMGSDVDIILGAQTEDSLILVDDFKELSNNIYFATDDGSKGTKGFVTTVLEKLISEGKEYDEVIAIGPVPMMNAVVNITKQEDIPTSVSLNPIMIDGTGMCGGCRVSVGGETKFACVDGPDFDGLKVDFEELSKRQSSFKREEADIIEHHNCKIGLGEDDV